MARVLFINAGSEGHINPTIGVVEELISRGEEVVYFCVEAYRERLEKTGADVRTLDGQRFIRAFVAGGREHLLQRINGLLLTAEVVIPGVLEQIEGERFDYVIHDSMFGCGRLLAQMLRLPAICSCTSFAQTEQSLERELQSFYANVPVEVARPIIDQYDSLAAMVKQAYGVEIGSPYEVFCNPAPLTLVYTTREFQPDGDAFDSSYRFVGPSISSRFAPDDFDVAAVRGSDLVYISLGTVFNQAVPFYRLCFEAFGDAAVTVVLSAGQRTSIAELGDLPANFIVRPYVPQTEVLQEASLFVTHGGMNSAHEGLYYGVPLLVIPQGADQPVIAERVAKLGAGQRLSMQGLTARQLREAADRVRRDSSFKAAAERMSGSLHAMGGYRQAADEILAFRRMAGGE